MNDKDLWILIERYHYSARTSLGRMSFLYNNENTTITHIPFKQDFGYTIEDTARPANIKVYGETCIPGGLECDVSLYEDEKFGKTIIFHTEPDKKTIIAGILKWEGCLAHGGNSYSDTTGCVLVAKNLINNDMIQGSLKDELRIFVEKKINDGYIIKARFTNLDQLQ